MSKNLQVSFHGVAHDDALQTEIEDRADKLTHLFDGITHCRVVIDAPHQSHHKGNQRQARVEIGVPGKEIVTHHEDEDAHVAMHDAFSSAENALRTYADKRKHH